jgi:ABC-2 type transport system ATP-binding protein
MLWSVLSVREVHKSYGDIQALCGTSFDVAAGSIVSLLGRNGAGKSTLLSIVAGLVKADSGSVSVDGVDVLANPRLANGLVGIAPQHTGIYPPLSVRENLEFFGELSGLTAVDRRSRATAVADQLGLAPLLNRKAMKLSGGEARRLHTGCALMHRPKVLMLDEPTVGADVTTRAQLIQAVRELAREGAAIVYTTHYLPEVDALDASIVIIDGGRVLTTGTREELILAHQSSGLELRTFVSLPSELIESLRVVELGQRWYRIPEEILLHQAVAQLTEAKIDVESIRAVKPDLESVFLAVTGSTLVEQSREGN